MTFNISLIAPNLKAEYKVSSTIKSAIKQEYDVHIFGGRRVRGRTVNIDFRVPREWAMTNENVAAVLAPPAEVEIYTFQNIQAAVTEAVFGLSQVFAHKKKIFYIKNINPMFEAAIMPLAKMGYLINALDAKVLDDPSALAATIDREVLFVLFAADDPLLGRRFDTGKLQEALREKPVTQIRVSHNAHLYDGLERNLPRTAAYLYSVRGSSTGAIALVGERARFGTLVSDQIGSFFNSDLAQIFSWATKPRVAVEEKIKTFENKKIAGAQPVLTAGARVFDRAIIAWPDMDGHAVITRLAEKLKITLAAPGFETRLETTSLSRWGGVRTMEFLRALGLSPETIRGLVMIAADLLNPELEKHLVDVRNELLKEQFAGGEWVTPNA